MKISPLLLLFAIFLCASCQTDLSKSGASENQYQLVPFPTTLNAQSGQFIIDKNTSVVLKDTQNQRSKIATDFLQKINTRTGYALVLEEKAKPKNTIIFQLDPSLEEAEGYVLSVKPDQILLAAKNPPGLFYGVQTLRQLLPLEFEKTENPKDKIWTIPAVEIKDAPRFKYRGMHLDVSRHFFEVAAIKQFLDQMAYHKLNHFHWHLTDDQGWRIEIKKYPKLTAVGGFRNGTLIGHYNDQPHQFDQIRYGGFYTQAQIKEVIQYAAERFITVVPEIELPGHAQAALAAYPELACEGNQFEPWSLWGVSENIFCPTETTFEFLENVLDEVIALFPGKYIHIGGDECPKTKWEESSFCQQLMRREGLKDEMELQSYFIKRIEKHINAKGKQIIGWDEILEGGLAPNATVMSWRGIEGGIEAAKAGHDVVMTPTSHCYFDYYQSDHPEEPLAIGGLIPLKKIYEYEPIPKELNKEEAQHILGSQANLWTEYIPNTDQLEYMAFPRLCALAEVVWSPKDQRKFEEFIPRISTHLKRLQAMGINAANHLYDLNSTIQPKAGVVEVQLQTLAKDCQIHFTSDGSEPSTDSPLYQNPLRISSDSTIKAQAFQGDKKLGRLWQQEVNWHHAAGKKIELLESPHPKYSGNGPGSLLNGVLGSDERYGDAEWLGFDGKNFEAVIDFGQLHVFKQVTFRFFNGEGQWIYLPKKISLYTSADGENFEELSTQEVNRGEGKVVETIVDLKLSKKSFLLKIQVENFGEIPTGRQGAGHAAWLFIDEIRIE